MARFQLATTLVTINAEDGLRAIPLNSNDARSERLSIFLQSDVQSSDASANLFLNELAKVENNECEENDIGPANLCWVKIYKDKVTIEIGVENDEPTFSYTHTEFREALEAALTVIKDHDSRTAS